MQTTTKTKTIGGSKPIWAEYRFHSKYRVDSNGCYVWVGRVSQFGYGNFRGENDKNIAPHIYAYKAFIGEIPKGFVLDHLCRNRACVNPDHLELVTQRENVLRGSKSWVHQTNKCKRGHEITEENTIHKISGSGYPLRLCKKCRDTHNKKRRVKTHAEFKDRKEKE